MNSLLDALSATAHDLAIGLLAALVLLGALFWLAVFAIFSPFIALLILIGVVVVLFALVAWAEGKKSPPEVRERPVNYDLASKGWMRYRGREFEAEHPDRTRVGRKAA